MSFWKQSDMPSSGKRVLGGMNERMRYESAQWVNTFWRQKSEIYGNVLSPFLNQIVTTLLFCDPKRPEEGEKSRILIKFLPCVVESKQCGVSERSRFFFEIWNHLHVCSMHHGCFSVLLDCGGLRDTLMTFVSFCVSLCLLSIWSNISGWRGRSRVSYLLLNRANLFPF